MAYEYSAKKNFQLCKVTIKALDCFLYVRGKLETVKKLSLPGYVVSRNGGSLRGSLNLSPQYYRT